MNTARLPGSERSAGQALAGIRILIVDDDEDMRNALQYLLECYGAVVTTAASAAEALECSRPDVLLSDIAMAGESGYDLMRRIAARESAGALPAAALSAHAREEDRGQAIAAGFRILIEKPIEPETLVKAVADLAGRTLTTDTSAARAW